MPKVAIEAMNLLWSKLSPQPAQWSLMQNPAIYSGWTVNTIEGMNALDFMKMYADKFVGQVR